MESNHNTYGVKVRCATITLRGYERADVARLSAEEIQLRLSASFAEAYRKERSRDAETLLVSPGSLLCCVLCAPGVLLFLSKRNHSRLAGFTEQYSRRRARLTSQSHRQDSNLQHLAYKASPLPLRYCGMLVLAAVFTTASCGCRPLFYICLIMHV